MAEPCPRCRELEAERDAAIDLLVELHVTMRKVLNDITTDVMALKQTVHDVLTVAKELP